MADERIYERLDQHGQRIAATEAKVGMIDRSLTKLENSVKGTNTRLDWLIGIAVTVALGVAGLALALFKAGPPG